MSPHFAEEELNTVCTLLSTPAPIRAPCVISEIHVDERNYIAGMGHQIPDENEN